MVSPEHAQAQALALALALALRADTKNWSMLDGDGCVVNDCYAMAKSITAATTTITAIHTRKGTTTITFVLLLILCCLCDYNYGSTYIVYRISVRYRYRSAAKYFFKNFF